MNNLKLNSHLLSKGVDAVSLMNASVQKTGAAGAVRPTAATQTESSSSTGTDAASFESVLKGETDKLNADAIVSLIKSGNLDLEAIKTAIGSSDIKDLSDLASKLTSDKTGSSQLSEMQSLIAALDKSILGQSSITDTIDKSAVAATLLADEDAMEVIGALAEGHLNGIVMSDSEDLEQDEEENLTGAAVASASGDTSLETLAENLETIMAGLNVGI